MKFVKNEAVGEIVEKKSRFIATLVPVKDEKEALGFIQAMRKKYYDARHNCYAYIAGDVSRSSDDGEPAHTAGRPMLDILESEGLGDVCVVVTRYFGGVLLGTGGLVRAYQGAVLAALENAEFYSMTPKSGWHIVCDYNDHGRISYLAQSKGWLVENTAWSDKVSFDLFIDPEEDAGFEETLLGASAGKAVIEKLGIILK